MKTPLSRRAAFLSLVCLGLISLAAAPHAAWALPQVASAPAPDDLSVNTSGETSYLVRDWVTCFTFAIGGLAGLLSMFFRRAVAGIFFALACFFLALEPLADLVVFHLLNTHASEATWNHMVVAANTVTIIGMFLGILCFIAALFTADKKKTPAAPAA